MKPRGVPEVLVPVVCSRAGACPAACHHAKPHRPVETEDGKLCTCPGRCPDQPRGPRPVCLEVGEALRVAQERPIGIEMKP